MFKKFKSWAVLFFLVAPFLVNALTISPPVFELQGNPGDKLTITLKVFNELNSQGVYYLSAMNFKAKGEERGEPFFYEATEEGEIASWFVLNNEPIFLEPGERKEIPIEIIIPKTASAGGHYGGIFLGTQPPGDISGSGVSISGKIGALILIKVSGDIKEMGKLLEFKLSQNKALYKALPINFYWRFENLGNVHLKPQGNIEIKNLFGRSSDVLVANPIKGSILPGSVRKYNVAWQKNQNTKSGSWQPMTFFQWLQYERDNFALGRYSAYLMLEYGVNGKSATDMLTFWVLPWELIMVSAIIIIIVIIFGFWGIRRYNRWIISRHLNKPSNAQ